MEWSVGSRGTILPLVKQAVNIEQSIAQGMVRMGIEVPEAVAASLATYVALLERWNRVYNLTAVRRPEDMVIRHILDSLSILPWIRGPHILDVGSGPGLPGIPLAVLRPEYSFSLLDSNGKRTRFMRQVIAELDLANVGVLHCRVEDYRPDKDFDSVISRAFASLANLLVRAGRFCAADGCLLAMKGLRPDDELINLPSGYKLVGIYHLRVPSLHSERHLVHLIPTRGIEARPADKVNGLTL